jgi:quinol monooxygenase YgiN
MAFLEVIARAKVRPGQLDGFTAQAAEIVRLTRERDTHTLRCDWFVNEDGTDCEVHEMFPDEQGLIEHKMDTMEATQRLFRDYASDHRSTLYGKVSEGFLHLVKERMGTEPDVFTFLQGLAPEGNGPEASGASDRVRSHHGEGAVPGLEVHARLRIRPGELEGFTVQAAEIMRLTREKDTQTRRYDWFVNEDGTECEVHEGYLSGQGLIDHNAHVMDARAILFEKYAYDHRMTAFGEVSQDLRDLGAKHAGGIAVYSLLQGLEAAPAV